METLPYLFSYFFYYEKRYDRSPDIRTHSRLRCIGYGNDGLRLYDEG